MMKVIWNEKEFTITTEDSTTVRDIEKMLPLTLKMRRNGPVEFVGDLPQKPVNDGRKTSIVKPNEVYYYAGWNVLCLNYAPADISPYDITYLGKAEDESLAELLKEAPDNIEVRVEG